MISCISLTVTLFPFTIAFPLRSELTPHNPIYIDDNAISINPGDYNKNSIITIKRADFSGVDFCFSLKDFDVEHVMVNQQSFQKLDLPGGGHTVDYGKAELPTISCYVAVPQGAEVSLDYEFSNDIILDNFNIYPSQLPKTETNEYEESAFIIDREFYSLNEYYPSSVIKVSPIRIMRGCRIILVTIFPISYNPAAKKIKILNDININIKFNGGKDEFISERYRSTYFQSLFDAFLINSNSLERAESNNQQRGNGMLTIGERADLLIVVHDDFYDEILPLVEWRHKTGIETKVVNFTDITISPDIFQQAEDFRDYMSNAYHNWDIPPAFLLIVGDTDHIPVNYLYDHPYDYHPTGTDFWYVAFDHEIPWPETHTDLFPELHAGRISVDDEFQLNIVVNKILDYSKNPYMEENWFDDILLAAYEEDGRFFIETSETIYDYLNNNGYNCNRQYEGGTPPGSTYGVIDAINEGVIIVNHRDHGSSSNLYAHDYFTGWNHPRFTTMNIQNNLFNGEKYPVMFSINCKSGWFDGEIDGIEGYNSESIGEIGLRKSSGGFVAVIAGTRVSYSGYNDELCLGFYDAMFSDFDSSYPYGGGVNPYNTEVFMISQILNYGKFWMYDKYIVPGGCDPYPWYPTTEKSRAEFEMFHVHGDPTMEIWTLFPQTLVVTHPEYITSQNSMQVIVTNDDGSPIEGALVCVSQENGIYVRGVTDSYGVSVLDLSSLTEDEDITLVVTKHNFIPYETSIPVILNNPPDKPVTPSGPSLVPAGFEQEYNTSTTDPDSHQVYYKWDWGDEITEWIGPYNSDVIITGTHIWDDIGDYVVKVQAKDDPNGDGDPSDGLTSSWSDPLQVKVVIPGDLDGDGDVDLADLAQLLGGYGMSSGAIYEDGDLDGDGDVDLADLAELLGNYGYPD